MQFERRTAYIDYLENGEKIHNAGFARLERNGEDIRFCIQVSKLHKTDSFTGEIQLTDGRIARVLGEIVLQDGTGRFVSGRLSAANLADGISYDTLAEIRIMLPGERLLRCRLREAPEIPLDTEEESADTGEEAADAGEETVDAEEKTADTKEKAVDVRKESADVKEKITDAEEESVGELEQTAVEEERRKVRPRFSIEVPLPPIPEDKWKQLWAIYPHVRPFQDEREYLSVRPEDFVILCARDHSLVGNSFLLHGYYNYEHLILTRVSSRGTLRYYIGVPGNFYEKEKQAALLYGFESFECKTEPAGEGEFGYYMHSVEI